MVDELLDLENLDLGDEDRVARGDLLDHCLGHSLDHRLLDVFSNNDEFLHDNGDLHSTLHNLLDLFHERDDLLDYSFHLHNPVLDDYLLSNYLDFDQTLLDCADLNYFLDDLGYLNDPLLYLEKGDYLLHDSFHDSVLHLNVGNSLFLDYVLHLFDDSLHNHLYLDDLRYLDDPLNNLLDHYWHLHYLLHDCLDWYYLLDKNLDLLDLGDKMVDLSLHFYNFLDLHEVFHHSFDLYHLGNLEHHLHQPFPLHRHFDNPLDYPLHRHNLLHNVLDNPGDLYRNVDDLLHLSDLLDLNDLLDHLVDDDDFRDLDDALGVGLHDYWLRVLHLEGLEDVFDVYDPASLLVDHLDNPLVDF